MVLQVEKANITPAVFGTSGDIGREADKLLRRMAEQMSSKRGETYSSVESFLRKRFMDLRESLHPAEVYRCDVGTDV